MSAANYPNPILLFTLQEEGGLSNLAGDPGGLTKWGITHLTYNDWRAKQGLPVQSVAKMTMAECAAIYASGYWATIAGDHIRSGIDLCVFDDGVNAGPGAAVRLLAKCGGDTGDVSALIERFCSGRIAFLRGLQGGKLWARFGSGWGGRVGRCQALALKMAFGSIAAVPDSPAAQMTITSTIANHAVNANAQAKTARNQGAATVTAHAGAGVVVQQQQLPLWVFFLILASVAIAGFFFWWRSANHSARGAALLKEAQGVIHGL